MLWLASLLIVLGCWFQRIIASSTKAEKDVYESLMRHLKYCGGEGRYGQKKGLVLRMRMEGYDASLCRSSWSCSTGCPGGNTSLLNFGCSIVHVNLLNIHWRCLIIFVIRGYLKLNLLDRFSFTTLIKMPFFSALTACDIYFLRASRMWKFSPVFGFPALDSRVILLPQVSYHVRSLV